MPVNERYFQFSVCVLLFLYAAGFSEAEQRSGRIVGGRNADIKDHPHMLLLRKSGYATCSAVVIGNKHALTAAHCVYGVSDAKKISLHGGCTTQTGTSVVFSAERVLIHPNYNDSINDNDVAIIEISSEFSGHQNVAPITLQSAEPSTSSSSSSAVCNITGWGIANARTNAVSNTLQVGSLQLITPRTCRVQWHPLAITSSMICARGEAADTCAGDSGGPLVCEDRLYGIVSWGSSRCDKTKPAVFTKIFANSIRSFIKLSTGI
ncbi:chymotrypsin-1-like [Anopheles marshallii]|uniref:chymotrypsin-1-like n=1 Tax=Anopheles marshallii TaxID=1521116 RepID=UPI00237B321F|nr:chymotrypsin-1-like [Anopheles marshallii]